MPTCATTEYPLPGSGYKKYSSGKVVIVDKLLCNVYNDQ